MKFVFRMKEALRIPMILIDMPYDRTITPGDVDPNGVGLLIHAENNVLAVRKGGSTLGLMDTDELGYYDPFTLIEIADE